MPDRRQHRGTPSEDATLFGTPARVHTLRQAAGDLAWLLARQYALSAALTLVGRRLSVSCHEVAGCASVAHGQPHITQYC